MSEKCVLISINPKWCELIANGKKTIEVRKSRPKLETPFKCYIYCTNDKEHTLFKDWIDPPFVTEEYNIMRGKGIKNVFGDNRPWGNANGKVIGEFVCDCIMPMQEPISGECYLDMIVASCIDRDELDAYGAGKPLYGWHISAPKIYGKPRELSEFYHPLSDKDLDEGNYDLTCGGEVVCLDYPEGSDMCADCPYGGAKPLKRPPQSWCYVEECPCAL